MASVPYDTVSTQEAIDLAASNDQSFLHVIRSEIDLPAGTDAHADAVYAQSAAALQALIKSGALVHESSPCLYVYRISLGAVSQTGVVGCCHVQDYDNNTILKHEKTRPDKEADRTRLNTELRAQPGPVFLTYRGLAGIDAMIEDLVKGDPLLDASAEDGAVHEIWRVDDGTDLVRAFDSVPVCYIADGHHRAAAAANTARSFAEHNPGHSGEEEYNWFLSVLFPAGQLRILPYNRCVKELAGLSSAGFVDALSGQVEVTENAEAMPPGPRHVSCYLDGRWLGLVLPEPQSDDAVSRLDVSLLQGLVLDCVLGISDPRTDQRIAFVGGIRGTQELSGRVDKGDAAAAFSMWPVTVDQMMDIADAGEIMPPKSTWFEPKLRSGLLIHTF